MKKKRLLERTRKKSYNSALERYKKKRRKEIALLVSIVSLIVLFIIFINSSFVNIKNINVQGLEQVEKNELIEKIGLNSEEKIWKINEEEIEQKIKDNFNIVSGVNVETELLNTMNIQIQEKKLLVQEEKNGQYIKLLEDGQEYTGKITLNNNLPILNNFGNNPVEKTEVLKSLSEMNKDVLFKISEISFDETNKEIANVYMRDGQRIKVNLVNFSSKMNHYNQIEKFIENKNTTVLNLVNGAYLETAESEKIKSEKVNRLLNNYIEKPDINDTSTTSS